MTVRPRPPNGYGRGENRPRRMRGPAGRQSPYFSISRRSAARASRAGARRASGPGAASQRRTVDPETRSRPANSATDQPDRTRIAAIAAPVGWNPGAAPREERPGGLSGLAVDEAALRGVVRNREGRLAVVEAPDGRTYAVRPGDRLFDGTVQEITGGAVLFRRDAADPAGERGVRKRLRAGEDGP